MVEIWAEKYRPQVLIQMDLPGGLLSELVNYQEKGFPNLLFAGNPGQGKTTAAKIISSGYDTLFINGSDDGRLIETFRNSIKTFCSTVSLENKDKLVLIDEADNLTSDTQMALRAFVEEYKDIRFILTANYPYKLLDALLSRFTLVRFEFPSKNSEEGKSLMRSIYAHITYGYDGEFNEARLKRVVYENYPDIRSIWVAAQKLSNTQETTDKPKTSIDDLIGFIKKKDFQGMRGFIETTQYPPEHIFTALHNKLFDELKGDKLAQMILIIRDGEYKSKFVFNQNLNIAATCCQLILECF